MPALPAWCWGHIHVCSRCHWLVGTSFSAWNHTGVINVWRLGEAEGPVVAVWTFCQFWSARKMLSVCFCKIMCECVSAFFLVSTYSCLCSSFVKGLPTEQCSTYSCSNRLFALAMENTLAPWASFFKTQEELAKFCVRPPFIRVNILVWTIPLPIVLDVPFIVCNCSHYFVVNFVVCFPFLSFLLF